MQSDAASVLSSPPNAGCGSGGVDNNQQYTSCLGAAQAQQKQYFTTGLRIKFALKFLILIGLSLVLNKKNLVKTPEKTWSKPGFAKPGLAKPPLNCPKTGKEVLKRGLFLASKPLQKKPSKFAGFLENFKPSEVSKGVLLLVCGTYC